MSPATRLWVAVGLPALALVAAASWSIAVSDHQELPRLQILLTAFTGGSFIGAGLIARTRRPLNRTGALLIAVGFGWLLAGGLVASNFSLPWTIGVAIAAVPAGFLVHLLLAYPSGRLGSRWELLVAAYGYALVTVGILVHMLFDPKPTQCDDCPSNAFLVRDNDVASDVINTVLRVLAVAFLLAVVATLVGRWRRSSPAARHALTPVLLAGGATLFLLAIHVGVQSFSTGLSEVADRAAAVVLIAVPFLFLWGLLQSRLARADIGRALAAGEAGGAQDRVRELLHDPTAELLYACAEPARGYVDVYGRPREPIAEPGRALTPIEREGRALAVLVHDEALLEEPELLEQVAAAVGLEIERDQNLFALQASERRSRALLDALPDKMFRLSGDGIVLDVQEEPAMRKHVGFEVGASVYDSAVPREHADHLMSAGLRALETGELQTVEWEVGEASNLRYAEGRFIPSGEDEFFVVIRDVTDRKRQEVEQAALHRVALAVASEARPEQIFDLVSQEIAAVLGAHTTNLIRYETGDLEAVIVGGWRKPGARGLPVGQRYAMEGSASEAVMKTGRPVRREFNDEDLSSRLAEQMRQLDVHSLVAAPIKLTGRPWGAVVATLTTPHSFPPGAEDRLGAFARLVSLALANEEARAELAASRARLVSAGDEERRRLERNLHDGAQQRLVSLSLSLRLAQGKLVSDPEGAKNLLSAAKLELDVALEELRELARGIHPAVLTERGLGPALQSLADRAPLPVELELPEDQRLPRRVEAAAYYIVSEALANVAKYSGATGVTVSIAQDNGFAVVEVADDGVGGADPQRGTGLRGLTDRIEALEGTLIVDSHPGRGTRIHAEIPYARQPVRTGS
jgi:signal transduction histidine kinase